MAMPSYDGQLSGPARKAGYEIQTQCRELKVALSNNAESIRKAAQGYEEVDNQTINLFAGNQELLSSETSAFKALYAPSEKSSGGNEVIGYQYVSPDVVEIWWKGKKIRVQLSVPPLSEEDYISIMAFIDFIDVIDTDKADMRDDVIKVFEDGGLVLLALLSGLLPGIGAWTAIAGSIVALAKMGYDTLDEILKLADRVKQYNDAVTEFNELFQSNDPGITIITP
jgi:hypothetical protein